MRARIATLAVCVLLVFVACARAQGIGDGAIAAPGHAWAVIQLDDGARLVHLPPRALTQRPAAAGSVRSARELKEMPVACAAVGDRVYLAFRDGQRHSVLSGRAVEAVGGLWTLSPDGRLDAHPSTPEGTLVGFVGSDLGPTALVRDGDDFQLARMTRDGWDLISMPEGVEPAAIVRWQAAPGVLSATGELWALEAEGWTRVAMPPVRLERGDRLYGLGARIVSVRPEEGRVAIRTHDATGDQLIARLEDPPADAAMTPIGLDGGRFALIWREPGEDARYRMMELSLATGEVFYDGPPIPIMPVSQGEFRVLAALLVVVAAAVLLIAIRPAGSRELVLPPTTALAEPGRRFAATFVDLLVALFVVARVFGVSIMDIATLTVIFQPVGWWALPGVLVVGWAVGSLFEAVFGRTFGKFLLGCRAVRGDGSGDGPGIWRSVVRNAIKWFLPPIPALSLFEPDAPHRGDAIAGVVVVIDVEAEPEAPTDG
ncbi:MAG: RDD family protein [Phycisphaerales bacterium]